MIQPGSWRLPAFVPQAPTAKQSVFLGLHDVYEALYGGAAGGGKSSALLMDAMQYVDVPGYSALIIRRTFPDLSQPGAIMDRAKSWLLPQGIRWHEGRHEFTFPSGARLKFGYLNSEKDRYTYQSAEYQYFAVDEGTQLDESAYTYVMSRVRRPSNLDPTNPLANVPLRVRMASNPGGIGHEWVKARFIPRVDEVTGDTVYPRAESGAVRVFVSARLADNPHLDAVSYIRTLQELDPVTRARLLEGDWGARPPGEMFDRTKLRYAYWSPAEGRWTDADLKPMGRVVRWVRAWDLASTKPRPKNRHPDWTAGVLMGLTDNDDEFVRDVIRTQSDPGEVETLIVDTAERDAAIGCRTIRMEQEPGSSGAFTTDRFQRKLRGYDFAGVRSSGPKAERARSFAAYVNTSHVWVPSGFDWVPVYVNELDAFPNEGLNDDQVDGSSLAHSELSLVYAPGSGKVAPRQDRKRGSSPYHSRRKTSLPA